MSAGAGYEISASEAQNEAFPQNSASPTYVIYGSSNSLDAPLTQTNVPEEEATAASGSGGGGTANAAPLPSPAALLGGAVGTNESGGSTLFGISTSTIAIGVVGVVVSFLIAKHFSQHG